MKNWDAIVIGGGVIGLSLALDLRRHGLDVTLIDRTEPGREASWASGGMIAHCDPHIPKALQPLSDASTALFPEFIHELQDESQTTIDFRSEGAILFLDGDERPRCEAAEPIQNADRLAELEPRLRYQRNGWLVPESAVDPRQLLSALVAAAKHRDIQLSTGAAATAVELSDGRVTAVRSEKTQYHSSVVINCAGAWAGQIAPLSFPTRPVKGHMLSVVFPSHTPGGTHTHNVDPLLRHVVRAPGVYIVPRSDGRLIIGSTVEEAGFDKRVIPEIIQRLHHAAIELVPEIANGRMLEAWTGLRPATPDGLPILGATRIPGYYVATGHYRDGIMLAPITAQLISQIVRGERTEIDLGDFSPDRF